MPNTGKRQLFPTDWSHDGRYLLLLSQATRESPNTDIWLYDFKEQSASPWLATQFEEGQARLSPDGNWVAYASNANGPTEVYLRPFRGEGSAVLVSSGGGNNTAWRGDGRELFYLSPGDELMAVTVKLGAVPDVGKTRRLFKVAILDMTGGFQSPYDVTPDGQRFLANIPERPDPLLFIQGVDELLKKGQQSSDSHNPHARRRGRDGVKAPDDCPAGQRRR